MAKPQLPEASAVILIGGKSSRMGQPKALLPFGGEPLFLHIVRALRETFNELVVVAAPDQKIPSLPVKLVRDDIAYQGPVAGIFYGLRAAQSDVAFVSSCDLPFLNLSLVRHLVSCISDFDVVVPYWDGRFQPLHAVYRKTVVPFLQKQLDRGELRPAFLYDRVRTRTVTEDEIRGLDPDGMSFYNINTPRDYELALTRWRER
jgi:molybdenum cofactor guanylyltransferase